VGSASSPLPFSAGDKGHRHLQKQKHTQTAVDFNFPFFLVQIGLHLPLFQIGVLSSSGSDFSSVDGRSSIGGLLWPLLGR
jgi:hypothetical protein